MHSFWTEARRNRRWVRSLVVRVCWRRREGGVVGSVLRRIWEGGLDLGLEFVGPIFLCSGGWVSG